MIFFKIFSATSLVFVGYIWNIRSIVSNLFACSRRRFLIGSKSFSESNGVRRYHWKYLNSLLSISSRRISNHSFIKQIREGREMSSARQLTDVRTLELMGPDSVFLPDYVWKQCTKYLLTDKWRKTVPKQPEHNHEHYWSFSNRRKSFHHRQYCLQTYRIKNCRFFSRLFDWIFDVFCLQVFCMFVFFV